MRYSLSARPESSQSGHYNVNNIDAAWFRALSGRPYVSTWIKDAAAKVREERGRREANQRLAETVNQTSFANAPAVFNQLMHQVRKDVEEINKEFPALEQKLDFETVGDAVFTVIRRRGRTFFLKASLNQSEHAIVCESDLPNMVDEQPYRVTDVFNWKLTDGGAAILHHNKTITYEEASQQLLQPALEGLV